MEFWNFVMKNAHLIILISTLQYKPLIIHSLCMINGFGALVLLYTDLLVHGMCFGIV